MLCAQNKNNTQKFTESKTRFWLKITCICVKTPYSFFMQASKPKNLFRKYKNSQGFDATWKNAKYLRNFDTLYEKLPYAHRNIRASNQMNPTPRSIAATLWFHPAEMWHLIQGDEVREKIFLKCLSQKDRQAQKKLMIRKF